MEDSGRGGGIRKFEMQINKIAPFRPPLTAWMTASAVDSRPSLQTLERSFHLKKENKTRKPMGRAGSLLVSLVVTAVVGFVYFYVSLPAIKWELNLTCHTCMVGKCSTAEPYFYS